MRNDRDHATELIHTVPVLLEARPRPGRATADALHLHANTVRQQIRAGSKPHRPALSRQRDLLTLTARGVDAHESPVSGEGHWMA